VREREREKEREIEKKREKERERERKRQRRENLCVFRNRKIDNEFWIVILSKVSGQLLNCKRNDVFL
jgi:hypothetical protein